MVAVSSMYANTGFVSKLPITSKWKFISTVNPAPNKAAGGFAPLLNRLIMVDNIVSKTYRNVSDRESLGGNMAIAVVAKEIIKQGQEEAFAAHMVEMIELTRQEAGCISYDLYKTEDDPEASLAMVELWESKEALDAHMASEHFQRIMPGTDAYKAAPAKVIIYKSV